jgi:hypothetical protein
MPNVISYALGLPLILGFGALGRWVFLHPEMALEKFNPYGKPYGKFFIRQMHVMGAVVVVMCVFGVLSLLLHPLLAKLSFIPDEIMISFFLAVVALISWQILTRSIVRS